MSLPTPTEFREYITLPQDASDDEVQDIIDTALDIIENHTGRVFRLSTSAKTFKSGAYLSKDLTISDFTNLTKIVELNDSDFSEGDDFIDDIVAHPTQNPDFSPTKIRHKTDFFKTGRYYKITGEWGWATLPDDLRMVIFLEGAKVHSARRNAANRGAAAFPTQFRNLTDESFVVLRRYVRADRIFAGV